MLVPNEAGCRNVILGERETHMQNLSKTIGKTLSSYTKAINLQNKTTGNLFQKKTKAKLLTGTDMSINNFSQKDCLLTCFHYIHQNPLKAKLVNDLKDWSYSSYPDYYNGRNGIICNKLLCNKLLDFTQSDFTSHTIKELDNNIVGGLF
ncbi:MAG: hypothetical protein JNM14_07555 [Ferruginibacter sp.]|nr:hypothetical protein [Ferruginibacter sp.]